MSKGPAAPTVWVAGLACDAGPSPQQARRIEDALELRVLGERGDFAPVGEECQRERRESEEMGERRELELELRMSFHNIEDAGEVVVHHAHLEYESSREDCSSRASWQHPGSIMHQTTLERVGGFDSREGSGIYGSLHLNPRQHLSIVRRKRACERAFLAAALAMLLAVIALLAAAAISSLGMAEKDEQRTEFYLRHAESIGRIASKSAGKNVQAIGAALELLRRHRHNGDRQRAQSSNFSHIGS